MSIAAARDNRQQERHVTREPVELRDHERRTRHAALGEGKRELSGQRAVT